MAKKAVTPKSSNTSADSLAFNKSALKQNVLILRAIDHPLRQKLLKLIDKKKNITVKEIKAKNVIDGVIVSQHLAILRKAGLVTSEKFGRIVSYTINYATFDKAMAKFNEVSK
jgi:predicted transcriptional regulator